ncbi:hypothetical protein BaRGS_00015829, partial [Batillaria attramentaria]
RTGKDQARTGAILRRLSTSLKNLSVSHLSCQPPSLPSLMLGDAGACGSCWNRDVSGVSSSTATQKSALLGSSILSTSVTTQDHPVFGLPATRMRQQKPQHYIALLTEDFQRKLCSVCHRQRSAGQIHGRLFLILDSGRVTVSSQFQVAAENCRLLRSAYTRVDDEERRFLSDNHCWMRVGSHAVRVPA